MSDDQAEVALPHAVALSWGIAERPERGPKRELSIERIVESAIEIADVEGLAAVSMSRVATSLGFTTMSLYRYVTSKDDLLLLMQDQALDMAIPPEDPSRAWREQLREWVLLSAQSYRAHPWFAEIPATGVLLTPNSLRLVDWGVRCLAATGLGARDTLAIVLLLAGYARAGGGVRGEGGDGGAVTGVGEVGAAAPAGAAAQRSPDLTAALHELVTAERFPSLRPVLLADDAGLLAGADTFEFGLDRYLDGVAHFIGQTVSERDRAAAAASSGGDG